MLVICHSLSNSLFKIKKKNKKTIAVRTFLTHFIYNIIIYTTKMVTGHKFMDGKWKVVARDVAYSSPEADSPIA